MLSILYPISFFASLLGLILWFYYQPKSAVRSKQMSVLFLTGFLVYLFSLAFSNALLSTKFFVLFRDLLVLGLVSQFFSFFRKNKVAFFIMLAVLYGLFQFKYFSYMQQSLFHAVEEVNQQPETALDINDDIVLAGPGDDGLSDTGELLVEIKEGNSFADLQELTDQFGLTASLAFQPENKLETDLDDYYLVDIPQNRLNELAQIIEAIQNSPFVDWVEGNENIELDDPQQFEVNRKRRIPQYGLNDPEINRLWGFEAMQVDQLYDYLRANQPKAIKKAWIAILDTGVDAQHEDIKGNYQSFAKKYDIDKHSHGTHCAGIAASVSNNGKGIASFSPENEYVEVGSIKVLGNHGGGTQKGIINGMIEAADKGADVISMSLGGRSNSRNQRAYQQAVEYASQKGAIVVVAAGNSNMNAKDYAPANTPGVITVAALDTNLNRASFSNLVHDLNRGIAAPGVGIYSSTPNNKYAAFNGTSMATPYVAGLLGLMKSMKPDLTVEEAYDILNATGKATGDTKSTGHLIQPYAAIKALNE